MNNETRCPAIMRHCWGKCLWSTVSWQSHVGLLVDFCFPGVELDKLQAEDQSLWPFWLSELCYRVSGWLSLCIWWKSTYWSVDRTGGRWLQKVMYTCMHAHTHTHTTHWHYCVPLNWTDSAFQDGQAMLWDLNEGKHLYTLDGGDVINSLCFSPNRYWLCAASGPSIKIWVGVTKCWTVSIDYHEHFQWYTT